MPYRSFKMRTFLKKNKPDVARQFESEYGDRVIPRRGEYGKNCKRCKYQQRGRQ